MPQRRTLVPATAAAGLLVLMSLGDPETPRALDAASTHDIPGDATIQMFVKPEGSVLRLLVRVPLESMQEIEFPLIGPGYLDLAAAGPSLDDAAHLWIGDAVRLFEDGEPLPTPELVATQVSIPSDASFASYDQALEHVTGPGLRESTQLIWKQALLDVLLEYPIASDQSDFTIDPGLERLALRVITVMRFVPPTGAERAYQYAGAPGLVRLDPRWHQAALNFIGLGFDHILDGFDHLLFLLCLVIPFRRLRGLVVIVTAFTVAHSITLIASASGFAPNTLWFPPLVETLIAASIVFMALENIIGANKRIRWAVAFFFGLVHGFGFSFALRETLQFAGAHLLSSLLAFNVGVELGQLAVLLVVVPALALLFKHVVPERMGVVVLSTLVAHTGWHWMAERGGEFLQYDVRWPTVPWPVIAGSLDWLLIVAVLSWVGWLTYRRTPAAADNEPLVEAP